MLRAAAYARYSSDRQDPRSIEDQLTRIHRDAARVSCEILPDHVYTDREITGSDDRRPDYQRLMDAARARIVDAIIVESQDRLWRDEAEMHRALKVLRFLGVKIFVLDTGAELTSRLGGLLASVTAWKDAAYFEDLREKTHRGLAGQARRGFNAGGRSYGYRTQPETDPDRVNAHGQPRVVGYRLMIATAQAEIVRRIFTLYAGGWSTKRIALQLNQDHIASPRGRASGWTWTALYGNPALGTGILNNRLYIGEVTWNRFRWEQNPETGKRVPRLRDRTDWIVRHDESLRIVPQELWDRVRHRQEDVSRKSVSQSHQGGRRPKYLLSGLLVCGMCGANYVIRNRTEYGCSFHTNRGDAICRNDMGVKRLVIEERLLPVVRHDLFTPEAIAYVTDRVNAVLQERARASQRSQSDHKQVEAALRQAMTELNNIRDAIRRGLTTDLTRQMLEEAEAQVRDLRAQLDNPVAAQLHALRILPRVLEARLARLDRVLGQDVSLARDALGKVLGQITLRPTPKGLVAEFQGNVGGLLSLDEQAPAVLGFFGSGGVLLSVPTRRALLA